MLLSYFLYLVFERCPHIDIHTFREKKRADDYICKLTLEIFCTTLLKFPCALPT